MRKKAGAFTLAEVLIVLTIIGVVAAITIPTLVQKTQNEEFVSSLKKFYSETNQALIQTAMDQCGSTTLTCFNSTYDMTVSIADQFKKSKFCGTSTTDDCWVQYNTNYDGTGTTNSGSSSRYKYITADGMSVVLEIGSPDCSDHNYTSNTASPNYNQCGNLYVDVNSHKGPNRLGRDMFIFRITSNKVPMLYPVGGKDDDYYWNGSSKYCQEGYPYGDRCAGRIMEEGWQMNY